LKLKRVALLAILRAQLSYPLAVTHSHPNQPAVV